jgi:hypothetical protein
MSTESISPQTIIHMIVPGGGISVDGTRWVACRPGFFLPVKVLSRLFRRLFLEKLVTAYETGRLNFFGQHLALADRIAFEAYLEPFAKAEWVVYAKPPFAGPEAVLAYLSRYTHRIAIANSGVTFKWKDYRAKGRERYKTMTLAPHEFIRRFLIHILPSGFHRIRHYGRFANGHRVENLALARQLLAVPAPKTEADDADSNDDAELTTLSQPCPHCGGRMIIIETFQAGSQPRAPPIASRSESP